jgi:ubiquinone biosynthesis protein COQ9
MPKRAKPVDLQGLLDAVLPHVAFDGWSDAALKAGATDLGADEQTIKALCPRGAIDLAVAYHKRGDAQMAATMAEADLAAMRYSERVAFALRMRLAHADREAVRRGTALFSLPLHAGEGAALIWGTADRIWTELGDTSRDVNWYSKRAILSAVYSSVVLFWLGDQSGGEESDAFIDRRIENVMQFEKTKAQLRGSKTFGPLMRGLGQALSGIRAPHREPASDLPGYWAPEGSKEG